MNHMPRGQIVDASDSRLARRTATKGTALGKQTRPGGAMNGAVHAAAAKERFVGGVDNRVQGKFGNVALNRTHALQYGIRHHDSLGMTRNSKSGRRATP